MTCIRLTSTAAAITFRIAIILFGRISALFASLRLKKRAPHRSKERRDLMSQIMRSDINRGADTPPLTKRMRVGVGVGIKVARLALLLATLIVPIVTCWAASPDVAFESSSRIVVTLRDSARTTSAVVRVIDVAELRGGSESLRDQIASLDLQDAPTKGKPVEVTARQIEYRLRVAGIEPRLVSIRGSVVQITASNKAVTPRIKSRENDDAVVDAKILLASYAKLRDREVEFDSYAVRESDQTEIEQPAIEQAVISAAQKCLTKQLPWPEENVVIHLAQGLPHELRDRELSESAICTAEMRSPGTPIGRTTLRIVLKEAGKRTVDVPVQFDVRHYENVVVTRKAFDRGHQFSADDFAMSWRDVTNLSGYCTSPDQLARQRVKRVVPESHIVKVTDVEMPSRSSALMPVVVKRRDRVTAFARSGSLMVTSVWEAQQDGRQGEVIKFKNIVSNKEVTGRVLSATEVEATD